MALKDAVSLYHVLQVNSIDDEDEATMIVPAPCPCLRVN